MRFKSGRSPWFGWKKEYCGKSALTLWDAKESSREEDDGFAFATDRDFEREKLITEMKSSTSKKITLNLDENTEEKENIEDEINFDDI